jgi:hypothetical protein
LLRPRAVLERWRADEGRSDEEARSDVDGRELVLVESLTDWALAIQANGVAFSLDALIRASEEGVELWKGGLPKAESLKRAKSAYLRLGGSNRAEE